VNLVELTALGTIDSKVVRREPEQRREMSATLATRRLSGCEHGTGHRSQILAMHSEWFLELIELQIDLTLEEIRAKLRERGVNVSVGSRK
jgi:hypothetical protein